MTQSIRDKLRDLVSEGVAQHGLRGLARELDIDIGSIRSIKGDRDIHLSSIERLLEALGMKLVIADGKGSASSVSGFAEAAAKKIDQSIDGSPEALRMGYLPIPYHDAQRIYSGAAPVAVARIWLRDELLEPENLRFVIAQDNALAPRAVEGALALIDVSDKATADAGLFAFAHRGKIGLGWITAPNPKDIVLSVGQDQPTITVFSGPDRADLRLLGRVQAIFNPMVSKEDFNAP